jgi:1-deoxy-D-xylulose-5-phosphate reductoisomerase
MAIPVAFALSYPERLQLAHLKPLSLLDHTTLAFEEPDLQRFPCLRLGYEALRAGGTMAACLNAANEELVAGFLARRLRFIDIPRHLETVMQRHRNDSAQTLEDLLEADEWARREALELMAADSHRVTA